MTKYQQIAEHVLVTFVEAAAAYLIVIPTASWTKTAIAGAAGAGLSAVYNLLRQSNPIITSQTFQTGNIYVPLQSAPTPVLGETVSPDKEQDAILDNLANEPEEPALITPPDTSPTV